MIIWNEINRKFTENFHLFIDSDFNMSLLVYTLRHSQ